MIGKLFQRVSQAPTNPHPAPEQRAFDIADLYRGPAQVPDQEHAAAMPLDEKLRQAYFWIVNHAVISPFYDIEYNDGPPQTFMLGDRQNQVHFPSGQSYCSFVLLPLLTFAVRAKCLLVGGPGRGKTSSAMLMGVLAGYSVRDVRRAIQKGQPQMTVADLLGSPLPADLVQAKSLDQIGIGWRKWLGMRVKIIDEYNRIPTRTQSALLTLLSDNYAELYDQTFECPDAAWYLTANDDAGGGTYQVIEALRDRIDIVVKALHFNTRFLGDLLGRIEAGIRPEEVVPGQIIFTEEETTQLPRVARQIPIPGPILRRIEFFASQFEYFDAAAIQLEYKTKDTAKLSAVDWAQVTALDTGKDKQKDIGAQTRNGLSVRSLMTCLTFVKAMAYFRGAAQVELEDVRQIMPFVLHDKLAQDADCPFFEAAENAVFRTDKIGWIRRMFDMACAEYDRLGLDKDDPVGDLSAEFEKGLEGVSQREVKSRLVKIERVLHAWSKSRKFYGHMFDDALKLKYLHQRYTNYLRWLEWKG
ncbi:MAG TPA: AAA family ATPase [Pirellulaceae bacterium]|nr:AAA family ATPase [Pirellulaceae bacterium]